MGLSSFNAMRARQKALEPEPVPTFEVLGITPEPDVEEQEPVTEKEVTPELEKEEKKTDAQKLGRPKKGQ